MSLSIARRGFLKALGFAAIAATPVFRSGVRAASAADPVVPKRFVGLKYCQGTRFSDWWPSGSGDDFTLGALPPLLAPFEKVKSKIIVPKGLRLAASLGPGGSHSAGMGTFLSGIEILKNVSGQVRAGGGVTIDQHLADRIGKDTRFGSLALGVLSGGGAISYRGRLQPVMPERSPLAAYRRLFSGLVDDLGADLPAEEVERLRRKRKSILDSNAKEITAIESQLGTVDRQRVQVHLDAIRRIERGFEVSSSCSRPGPPTEIDPSAHESIPQISRQHLDLLVLALSCGLTRVGTLTWGSGGSGMTFPWLGIPNTTLHSMSHYGRSNTEGQANYRKALLFFYQEIAYFLERLDAIVEADGKTLLDHSAVLVGTDNGEGNSHTISNIPFVLAGSAGGVFRTGRFIEYPKDTPHNGLLVAIANAFGSPIKTFGNPAYGSGPLGRLS
jgi:hypothetical protein